MDNIDPQVREFSTERQWACNARDVEAVLALMADDAA
jgi:ketosteroid isomerase-like protein